MSEAGTSKGSPVVGFPLLLATVVLAGCVSRPEDKPGPEPEVTRANRERGIVELTYDYEPGESPDPDWSAAEEKALDRCRQWGYERIRPKGDISEECRADNRYRKCTRYFVSKTWECGNSSK